MAVPGSGWTKVEGQASDIAVAIDGSGVFHIGNDGAIFQWDGANFWNYTGMRTASLGALAAGREQTVWFFGLYGGLFSWSPSVGMTQRPVAGGKENDDIGVCGDGSVWSTDRDNFLNQRKGIYILNAASNTFTFININVGRISGGGQRKPWRTKDDGDMFVYTGTGTPPWAQVDGKALDVGVSIDEHAWHIGVPFLLYYREPNGWVNVDAPGTPAPLPVLRVSVGPGGLPWVVTAGGLIFRRT